MVAYKTGINWTTTTKKINAIGQLNFKQHSMLIQHIIIWHIKICIVNSLVQLFIYKIWDQQKPLCFWVG